MIKKIVDWIFYKLSVVALLILCISTVVMIVSIFDVSFSTRANEYFMTWGIVACVCVVLMIPHLVERYQT
jgi:hypothetical protein